MERGMTSAVFEGSSSPILDAVLDYARRGIPLFPVWRAVPFRNGTFVCGCGRLSCTAPAKHPLARAVPHGLRDASSDETRVRNFWSNYPDANIGAVMGAIVAIDIDLRHGGNVGDIEKIHGAMPRTWRARTGSGGEHIYFATSSSVIRNSRGQLATGVDIRGQGGFAILPPSLHISGNRYAWQRGCAPDELPLAPLPSSIAATLEQPKQVTTGDDWAALASADVVEGGRNTTIAKFAGHLLRHYVDPRVVLELLLAWNATRCKPPLDRKEVVRTINSIAGAELRRRSS
jgi:hypothetical protein